MWLNGCAPRPGPCVSPGSPLPAPTSAQPLGHGLLASYQILTFFVARVASSPFPQQEGGSGGGFAAGPACRAADLMLSGAGRLPEVPRGSHKWALQEGARRVLLDPR